MSRFDGGLLDRAMRWAGAGPPTLYDVVTEYANDPDPVEIAASLCRRFEGFYARPYLCPAGVPTIGYGATRYLDGRRVQLTDAPISEATAERLLLAQLKTVYLPSVLALCPRVDDPFRVAALLDFTFNLGASNLQASTLRKRVNEDAWEYVPDEFRKWNKAAGRVLKGLVLRREAEVDLLPVVGT